MRRRKNLIKALTRSDGNLTEDSVEMQHMTSDFYKTLYTSEGVQNMDQVLDHVPQKVNAEMNAMLTAPYDPNEVKNLKFLCSRCFLLKHRA
jgi:hypothetical protein